jgi:hypothetical protein
MKFFKNYIQDLKKNDSVLAFFISTILYYYEQKNIKKSILFSIKFVMIFLLFLNLFYKN